MPDSCISKLFDEHGFEASQKNGPRPLRETRAARNRQKWGQVRLIRASHQQATKGLGTFD
jgi:hypothetical protein